MKKFLITQMILLSFLFAIVGIVKAQTTIEQDSYVIIAEPPGANHSADTLIWAQDSLNSCNDTRVAYLQVDVTGLDVNTGQLILTAGPLVAGPSVTLTLYGVADIPGGVNGVNTGNDVDPPIASDSDTVLIQSVSAPSAANEPVVFGAAHPTTSNLGDYIAAQASGDGIATFALKHSAGCGAGSTTTVFHSLESANPPVLNIWNPTAVSLEGFSAANNNNSFIWLALALPLIVVLSIILLRRRDSVT